MGNMRFKQFVKEKVIGTRHEWESHIDNMFRLFHRNMKTYKPDNILDVGSGDGLRTVRIAQHFDVEKHDIYGVDYDEKRVTEASKMFNAEKIDLEIETLPYDDEMFDLVVCNQVLEHLKNYRKVIDDIIRVTKREGYVVFGIPNLAHLINRIYLLFSIQPLCICLDGNHVRAFTHTSFLALLRSLEGVNVIDYTGSLMYPLPFRLGNLLARHFVGLSGYVCYLLRKV